jgi:hypothetical protein
VPEWIDWPAESSIANIRRAGPARHIPTWPSISSTRSHPWSFARKATPPGPPPDRGGAGRRWAAAAACWLSMLSAMPPASAVAPEAHDRAEGELNALALLPTIALFPYPPPHALNHCVTMEFALHGRMMCGV